MNKIKNFTILIAIIIYARLIESNEDLIELNCVDDTQCKQFEHPDIKSSCIRDKCLCTSRNGGERVTCQPMNPKINNVIGGSCPCKVPNGDCGKEQNICHCISNFIPSRDKRRCIPEAVPLGGKCEETSQCQRADLNAICHESKECKCMDHFVNDEGVCISVLGNQYEHSSLGNQSTILNDTQCQAIFGPNTRYSQEIQQCVCANGYFASIDNAKCLKVAQYLENCTENLQCIGTMGIGGKCVASACKCSEKYFVDENKNAEGVVKNVCTPVVQLGDYCRFHKDCYQRQLSETEQTMHCTNGECNCKDGFKSFNEGACIEGSGTAVKSFSSLQIICIIFTIVMLSN